MKEVNVIVGRFQPLTQGHTKIAEMVWKEFNIPTVFCVIDTPASKLDSRHPFESETIIHLNRWIEKEKYFAGFTTVLNADIGKISKACRDIGCEPVMWSCGTDRYEAYKKQAISKYLEMYNLTPNFKIYEVKRGDDDISASAVREALKRDDRKDYDRNMPVWSRRDFIYNIYRESVLKYVNENKNRKMKSIVEFISESLGNITESSIANIGLSFNDLELIDNKKFWKNLDVAVKDFNKDVGYKAVTFVNDLMGGDQSSINITIKKNFEEEAEKFWLMLRNVCERSGYNAYDLFYDEIQDEYEKFDKIVSDIETNKGNHRTK